MSLSAPFIKRPIATILLSVGLLLLGALSCSRLPIASLPAVDRPTIVVYAELPGASPEMVASALTQPLEHELGTISGIVEMAAYSSSGGCQIVIQFELRKNIDGAAGEVQAAINAATPNLPKDIPRPPYYYKANPAGFAVVALALYSDELDPTEVYNYADSVVSQRISEILGVARVYVSGAERRGVRIQAHPRALANMGISLEQIRGAVRAATANLPKGAVSVGDRRYTIGANDQLIDAADYMPVVVAFRNGAPVRLSDVATVRDGVINYRLGGWYNTRESVQLYVFRQPDANVVAIVDAVKALLPQLRHWLPPSIKVRVVYDRTLLIRASILDLEMTIGTAVLLVVAVIAIFLRCFRATLIPAVTIPVALATALVVMYVANYSLDNLSLMAITIAVGFVVDDAVIIVENVMRRMDEGETALKAALEGTRQMAFTVIAITVALSGALIPVLFMPDVIGLYFREFGITLVAAIAASAVVSLTLAPVLCSRLRPRRLAWRAPERIGAWALRAYERSLDWTLSRPKLVGLLLAATLAATSGLFMAAPRSVMPTQDTGVIRIRTVTNASVSFTAMIKLQRSVADAILEDPAVDGLSSYIGTDNGSALSNGYITVNLKPLEDRKLPIGQVITRMRERVAKVNGIRAFFNPLQDLSFGAQSISARYQYTLSAIDPEEVFRWAWIMRRRIEALPEVLEVITDLEVTGIEAGLTIDRLRAAAMGVTPLTIDNHLYDAFGQRQIRTIYLPFNYSRVVLEVDSAFQTDLSVLQDIFLPALSARPPAVNPTPGTSTRMALPNSNSQTLTRAAPTGLASRAITQPAAPTVNSQIIPPSVPSPLNPSVTTQPAAQSFKPQVPLSVVTRPYRAHGIMWLHHTDQFPSVTISFDAKPGVSISQAIALIRASETAVGMPDDIKADFRGEAAEVEKSHARQLLLFAAAIFTIYIALGVLYESFAHPLTILSTLPSAALGALSTLALAKLEFTAISAIGCILVIGMVMKNGIMLVDFALSAQRNDDLSAEQAIREAARLRARPILMTTLVAILSAVPLALGTGPGHELRQPLGLTSVGGLFLAQVFTLYTTPVIYLFVERMLVFSRKR
jgi:multidrug efflux pump